MFLICVANQLRESFMIFFLTFPGAIRRSLKPSLWPPSDLKSSLFKVPTLKISVTWLSTSWRAWKSDPNSSLHCKITKHQVRPNQAEKTCAGLRVPKLSILTFPFYKKQKSTWGSLCFAKMSVPHLHLIIQKCIIIFNGFRAYHKKGSSCLNWPRFPARWKVNNALCQKENFGNFQWPHCVSSEIQSQFSVSSKG